MAMFNSYFDITSGYLTSFLWKSSRSTSWIVLICWAKMEALLIYWALSFGYWKSMEILQGACPPQL